MYDHLPKVGCDLRAVDNCRGIKSPNDYPWAKDTETSEAVIANRDCHSTYYNLRWR